MQGSGINLHGMLGDYHWASVSVISLNTLS